MTCVLWPRCVEAALVRGGGPKSRNQPANGGLFSCYSKCNMCEICELEAAVPYDVEALLDKYQDILDCADDWTERNLVSEFIDDLKALR